MGAHRGDHQQYVFIEHLFGTSVVLVLCLHKLICPRNNPKRHVLLLLSLYRQGKGDPESWCTSPRIRKIVRGGAGLWTRCSANCSASRMHRARVRWEGTYEAGIQIPLIPTQRCFPVAGLVSSMLLDFTGAKRNWLLHLRHSQPIIMKEWPWIPVEIKSRVKRGSRQI